MKLCSKCKTKKPESDFNFKNKERGILHSYCKLCWSSYVSNHYIKHSTEYKQRARKNTVQYRQQNRVKIIEYLSVRKCVDCGESNIIVLDFDHRNSSTKKHSVSQMMDFGWEAILEEIKKCDVRCSNCHRIKTSKENGSFRYWWLSPIK